MSTLTVLTLVPSDSDRLPKALESVSWADVLFCVIDSRASQETIDLVHQYTDQAPVHEYVNAASQRNWALPQIQTEWTLVLDADEWVSEALAARIREIIQDPASADGYNILRHSYFLGKLIRYCGWHRDYNLRLFRTAKGKYLDKRVHSKVVIEGRVDKIKDVMYHNTYRSFEEYFDTFQRFTTWGAQDAYERGKRAALRDIILRPVHRFLKMYFWDRGFLDGYHGAVLCGLSACSVFTKYAKLWKIQSDAEQKKA
ncbi:MAG: glycosyltransferase family 2 protein [Candidatus Hydrogenedens sp.]|nr:glycosyltransferase family 2 protein [Candidatus Hydrogenedens sp.]